MEGKYQDTEWRLHHTEHVTLGWSQGWDDRRVGKLITSPDRRTVAAVFSTSQGNVAVVGHYGMASPRTARHGEGRAPACVAQLLRVMESVGSCKMTLLLADLNIQKRSARIDTVGAPAPDAAEKLWERTVRGARLVDPVEVLGIEGA